VGIDDYLLNHTVVELEGLVSAPRSQSNPAAPTLELLDSAPMKLRRPLALLDGRAYAAISPHVRVTVREASAKMGRLSRTTRRSCVKNSG
jgi:hypothetical protein